MNLNPSAIFYSFRRCPYAMRARLALLSAGVGVELREIELRRKPAAMLAASPKGTVPVLQLADGRVIAESLDIMLWALRQHDPEHWLAQPGLAQAELLIARNDGEFKYQLDRYKYADRYPQAPAEVYRQHGETFVQELESRLQGQPFLTGAGFALADAAILPFIRQFAAVDAEWFQHSPYPKVRDWLSAFTASELFAAAMRKYAVWEEGQPGVVFGPADAINPILPRLGEA